MLKGGYHEQPGNYQARAVLLRRIYDPPEADLRFCQIVKEITGSDQYMVVGIDVGKDKHHAFVGTTRGICLF